MSDNPLIAEEVSSSRHITRKAGRGIVWNFLTYGLGRGAVLVTTAILARVLTKDDFGLLSIAIVAINYLALVKDLGLGLALIQRRDGIDEAANVVFTVNLIIGFTLSAVALLVAPFFADYFNEPRIVPVLRWLGVSFAINALGAVHVVLLMKDLDYRRKFIPDMGNTIVKGVASISLAFAGFGVWALVFGQLLGAIASVILVWVVVKWRPRLSLDTGLIGSLMKFGSSVTVSDFLGVIIDNIDYIIVGKVFGLVELSIYTLAYRLPEMLLIGNLWVMGGVTFPAFSSIQDRPDEMRRGVLASVRLIQLLAVPISLGLFLAADPIIRVAFGEQWLEAIPVLRVLAVYAWVYSIGYHIGDVYKAIGRPDILLGLTVLTVIVIVPSIWVGSHFGLIGVAWGHLFAVLIRRLTSLTLATKFVRVKIVDIFKELKPAAIAGLAMTPPTLLVLNLTAGFSPFIQLALVVLTGMVSYLGVLWWLERDNLLRLVRLVGGAKSGV
ncbi:MAG: lipopolysaccharide biosynthesis protein [Anaerolineales bacterium]|nr:lipopolysaccharide biosynthesis protein [Anaerolineales bacterium]